MADIVSESLRKITVVERINDIVALKRFGALVGFDATGSALVTIDQIKDIHTGGMESKAINGMTLMGLLDTAMCAASLHRLGADARCATLEMSVKFIKPVLGASVQATGRVVSRADDILFCDASVSDGRGRIRVIATGVIRNLKNRRERLP